MSKINIIYIAIIPLVFALYQMASNLESNSILFYGFAENKETELSHDQHVSITKILVKPGQEVSAGQLLMEVQHADIDLKIMNAHNDIEKISLISQNRKTGLRNQIDQLNIQKSLKISDIEHQINALKTKIDFNQNLINDLKIIDSINTHNGLTPDQIKLYALRKKLTTEIEPIDVKITQLTRQLSAHNVPSDIEKIKLNEQIKYYNKEKEKFNIIAPRDGIVGDILCKEGENISAFSTLIDFYERNPTIVKAFVHESMILEVNTGDSLTVSSTLHPPKTITGVVIGLGSRVVEIPDRLRKLPEIKTYGREVLIKISPINKFLQKEKVILSNLNNSAVHTSSILEEIKFTLGYSRKSTPKHSSIDIE